jgi:hypothetical protein
MELLLAVLVAGPLGFFVRSRSRALLVYLGLWAVVFPVQCVVVHAEGDLDPSYWPINAVILAGGVGLNQLGWRLRARRTAVPAVARP